MRAALVGSVLILAVSALVVWRRQGLEEAPEEGAPEDEAGSFFADVSDTVAETVQQYTGLDLNSSRYTAALADPRYAQIIGLLRNAEDAYGMPRGLLVRQAWQESRFNPRAVNRNSGAAGLMQFMPATAREWGVDVFDAASSADGAGRYMAWLYDRVGTWPLALAAYNWGVGNVLRRGVAGAPAETKDYVSQIAAAMGWA